MSLQQLFELSPEAEPIVPLALQPLLALVCTAAAIIGTGAFIVAGKKSAAASVLYALIASVFGGFGLVFITNAVHVYTG